MINEYVITKTTEVLKYSGIFYLFSLLSYGMGYSKVLVLNSAVTEYVDPYDYIMHESLAMGYFGLVIFLAVIGCLLFYFNNLNQEIIETIDVELVENCLRENKKEDLTNRPSESIIL